MGKAEFGTAKYISKQLKARGLQKLRYYCQVCKKQCRDENGFKSHIRSPHHLKMISNVNETDIQEYTQLFEKDFLRLLRTSHGEKKIEANKFYNEFIQDKDHIHMNSTTFTSLTKFIQHLEKTGKIQIHVDKASVNDGELVGNNIDMGQSLISYIDRSQNAIEHNEKIRALENGQKTEQEIKHILLKQQIERAKKQELEDKLDGDVSKNNDVPEEEFNGKISINLNSSSKTSDTNTQNKVKKQKRKKKNVFKS
ncbi:hypothetical protein TBLA_0A09210 [Henningerozyma blattae CBS 6284]|uniref:DNA/RNA-binding protein Kin17 WH-like domain-containing protein n=1 Tax=Henningerozyma blattae (strain ATCC 34711 / CBS 6284 / DSM 70876 / NBRC 10599 / NRRL Y-10934 / UCD 77-7) TaxID=1071380 RepID=I2GX57_HENB6|nr:hypothetical protein TBLA_0A09210 [Tetrapisispora blattae CBS 6284]CCH58709.1 hypothetical protein TBLA_0A09210 [Tetrapisispora blattae CBS 6284]